ncbi:MAG: class IV adenylate cyclase [Candidatus Micrarchaeota archaeon]
MMLETEIKLRVKDPKKIREKLRAAGALHTKTAKQVDGIFDYPDGRMKKKGEVMRLRVLIPIWPDGERIAIVTRKGKKRGKGAVKVRTENEFETDDLKGALEELKEQGLEKKLEYMKQTEFWTLGKIKVTLDHFPHFPELGYFLELEASLKEIEKGMKLLSLSKKDAVKETYPEMMWKILNKKK